MVTAEGYKVAVSFWLKPYFIVVTAFLHTNSSALSQFCKRTCEKYCAQSLVMTVLWPNALVHTN